MVTFTPVLPSFFIEFIYSLSRTSIPDRSSLYNRNSFMMSANPYFSTLLNQFGFLFQSSQLWVLLYYSPIIMDPM